MKQERSRETKRKGEGGSEKKLKTFD